MQQSCPWPTRSLIHHMTRRWHQTTYPINEQQGQLILDNWQAPTSPSNSAILLVTLDSSLKNLRGPKGRWEERTAVLTCQSPSISLQASVLCFQTPQPSGQKNPASCTPQGGAWGMRRRKSADSSSCEWRSRTEMGLVRTCAGQLGGAWRDRWLENDSHRDISLNHPMKINHKKKNEMQQLSTAVVSLKTIKGTAAIHSIAKVQEDFGRNCA